MDFYPNEPLDENRSQCEAWKRLKEALRHDEGVAYYRYPVFSGQGARRHEPDILLVHREYGVWVLECKGCRIHNIHSINGQVWQMRDWYRDQMHPIAQADDQHWAVKNLVQRHYELRQLKLPFTFRVVLPFVTRSEWQQHGYEHNPVTRGVVWLAEDLRPATLRSALQGSAAEGMPKLSDAQFQRLLGTFRGVVGTPPDPHTPTPTIDGSLARVVRAIEREFCFLDTQQERAASEIPPGPQRIRGLAGTGKTVQLAWRAAFIHARYPDWDIAFMFYTKSLYQMVRTLIEQRYSEITDGGTPNWQKLTVWHAWGGRNRPDSTGKLQRSGALGLLPLGGRTKLRRVIPSVTPAQSWRKAQSIRARFSTPRSSTKGKTCRRPSIGWCTAHWGIRSASTGPMMRPRGSGT